MLYKEEIFLILNMMTSIDLETNRYLLPDFTQNAYKVASTLASSADRMQNFYEASKSEVLSENQLLSNKDDSCAVYGVEFAGNCSYTQFNSTLLEDSPIDEPKVLLGYTSLTNFMIGCFMLFLM